MLAIINFIHIINLNKAAGEMGKKEEEVNCKEIKQKACIYIKSTYIY
jgi:hypothetical protein